MRGRGTIWAGFAAAGGCRLPAARGRDAHDDRGDRAVRRDHAHGYDVEQFDRRCQYNRQSGDPKRLSDPVPIPGARHWPPGWRPPGWRPPGWRWNDHGLWGHDDRARRPKQQQSRRLQPRRRRSGAGARPPEPGAGSSAELYVAWREPDLGVPPRLRQSLELGTASLKLDC